MYTVGTLFSGIGVPDLAAELLGMTTVWQVEKEPFAQKVLRKNFPNAALYGDIFEVSNLPYVDVVVAGFPCQPFSLAGKRMGEKDDRYLVPEMFRVIEEVQPRDDFPTYIQTGPERDEDSDAPDSEAVAGVNALRLRRAIRLRH